MQKNIIITIITLSTAVLLVKFGVLHAFVMFVLMGQIPGTSYSIPASAMLALLSITALLIAASIVAAKMQHTTTIRRLIKRHLAHKARMPRRRFGQV